MHNLQDLSVDELKALGEELLAKANSAHKSNKRADQDRRFSFTQELLSVDKELIARGCMEYQPVVTAFETRYKAEIESKKNESVGLIGIGVVVMSVTFMLDKGFSLDVLALVIEGLALIAIIAGSIRYRTEPRLFYPI